MVCLCEWSCFSEGGRNVGCGPTEDPSFWSISQPGGGSAAQQTGPAPAVEGNQPPCIWCENDSQAQLCLPPPQAQTGSLSASCLTEDSNGMCVGGPEAGNPLIDQVPLSPEASYPLLGELHQCTCTTLVTLCRAGTKVRRVMHSLILRGTKCPSNQEKRCYNI